MVPCKRITGSGRSAELIAKEERISRMVEENERNLLRIGRGKIFSYEINVIGIKRRAMMESSSIRAFIKRNYIKFQCKRKIDFYEEFLLVKLLNLFIGSIFFALTFNFKPVRKYRFPFKTLTKESGLSNLFAMESTQSLSG